MFHILSGASVLKLPISKKTAGTGKAYYIHYLFRTCTNTVYICCNGCLQSVSMHHSVLLLLKFEKTQVE